ncbi:MAG: hypothetical protein U0414_39855 [Polyangiaceae bacterium]
MRVLRAAVIGMSFAVLGCGSQQKEGDAGPSASVAGVGRGASASSSGAQPSASVARRAPAASAPLSSGRAPSAAPAPCVKDSDCDWDDPCMANVCLPKARVAPECDKSRPPPGDCLCVLGTCALKPAKPPAPVGPCEWNGCVVDPGRATCTADTRGLPESQRFAGHVEGGPSCDCDPEKGCVFSWFEPVPCKTDDDCWISETPRLHPVPKPKGHAPFKPCKDGESSPQCGTNGFCTFGKRWKC